jgi:hypothetical protein
VQRDAAYQASESVVEAVSDLLLASIIVLAVLSHVRVSEWEAAGGSAFRVQAPPTTVDMQLGAVTTFMQSEKGRHKPHVSVSSVPVACSFRYREVCGGCYCCAQFDE